MSETFNPTPEEPSLDTQYDKLAKLYENLMGNEGDLPNKHLLNPILVERLPENPDMDVLEVGCGTGRWSSVLGAKYRSVVALDKAEEMLKIAHEKRESPNIHYAVANLNVPLPLKDNSFGFSFSNMVMHYVENIDVAAQELHRVLKPGSRLVFSTMHPEYDSAKDPSLRDKQMRTKYTTETLNGKAKLEMFYEPLESFTAHFTNAGFKLVEQKNAVITPKFAEIYPRYADYVGLARFAVFVFEK